MASQPVFSTVHEVQTLGPLTLPINSKLFSIEAISRGNETKRDTQNIAWKPHEAVHKPALGIASQPNHSATPPHYVRPHMMDRPASQVIPDYNHTRTNSDDSNSQTNSQARNK